MNIPVHVLMAVFGILCTIVGAGLGMLWSAVTRPAAHILSPYLLFSLSVLVLAVTYAASVFFDIWEQWRRK